jgi:hypothetical protein
MRSGWESCLEMCSKYTFFVKIIKKDDIQIGMFPHNSLHNQLLKEDCVGQMQITSKNYSCCSCMVVPAELADLEPKG